MGPGVARGFWRRDKSYVLLTCILVQGDTQKRELLKNPTKIEEIQEKENIDRN